MPIALDMFNGIRPVADPAEAALSPDGSRIYIVYGGTDDMNVAEALGGPPYIRPLHALVPLGANPRAVAVSPDGVRVYVLNALDFTVRVFGPRRWSGVADITLCASPMPEPVLRGQRLFHRALLPIDGPPVDVVRELHPGGEMDGRTWRNPEGPRNTTSLLGMARTGPLHWSADRGRGPRTSSTRSDRS